MWEIHLFSWRLFMGKPRNSMAGFPLPHLTGGCTIFKFEISGDMLSTYKPCTPFTMLDGSLQRKIAWTWVITTMWGPPNVTNWFINPVITVAMSIINHTYWSYVHQLSYQPGAPLCRDCSNTYRLSQKVNSPYPILIILFIKQDVWLEIILFNLFNGHCHVGISPYLKKLRFPKIGLSMAIPKSYMAPFFST